MRYKLPQSQKSQTLELQKKWLWKDEKVQLSPWRVGGQNPCAFWNGSVPFSRRTASCMMVVLDKMEPWAAKISVDAIPARAVEWWGGWGVDFEDGRTDCLV